MCLSLDLLLAGWEPHLAALAQHRGCLDVLPWHRNALAQGAPWLPHLGPAAEA